MPEENENGQDKTEQATSQRRLDFRKRGDVFQSKEIASVAMLVVSVLVFYLAGVFIFENIMNFMKDIFSTLSDFNMTEQNLYELIKKILKIVSIIMAPVILGSLIAGLGSSLAQVGFLFSSESIKFDFDRINPASGFKRLLDPKKLADVLKAIIKLTIIGVVAYFAIKSEMQVSPKLVAIGKEELLPYLGDVLFRLCLKIGAILIILALFDYLWERHKYEQKIMMTKQELKEDFKKNEGDPLIKSRIRSIQRAIVSKRMMDAVPKAQVIITNPTELAIALSYERNEMPAPKILAKGSGYIAEKIKEIAKLHSIPIVVNKPLAHAMFKSKIGQYIPKELFEATAQVLAYIFRLKGGKK